MFCPECGNKIEENSLFCSSCGYKFENQDANTVSNVKKVKKPINKALVGVLSIVICLCLVAGIGSGIYFNSESYKISKAETLILDGEFHKALDKIDSVNTDQAEAMREFVDLELSIKKFLENYSGGLINDSSASGEEVLKNLDEVLSCIDGFQERSKYSWLPKKLADKYHFYYTMQTYWNDNFFEYELVFCEVQEVFNNPVVRNQATEDSYKRFTLEELQENVDVSQNALNTINSQFLKKSWPNIGALSGNFLESEEFTNIKGILDSLINKVTEEIATQQESINESMKKFDMDDDLYLTTADPNYTYRICDELEDISYRGNEQTQNGDIIYDTLTVKFYQYCLENYTTTLK